MSSRLITTCLAGGLLLTMTFAACGSKSDSGAPPETAPKLFRPIRPVTGTEKTFPDGARMWVLPSGQTLIVRPVPGNSNVTINTWVRVGSADETEANNGVSHFLEHLLFKGTDKFGPRDLDVAFEGAGGDINASTSSDFTNYFVTAQASEFERMLEIHADMIQHATIPADELEQERKVVIEEINRANDSPMRRLFMNLNSLAYRQHPYRLDTLGPASNIASISRESILSYYEQHYSLNNLITVVAGGVDPETVKNLVEKHFRTGRTGGASPVEAPPEPWPTEERRADSRMGVKKAYVAVAWRTVPAGILQESVALDVAAEVLGQGESSRLHQRLVRREQIANSVSAYSMNSRDGGVFAVLAVCEPEKAARVEAAILEEIELLRTEGPQPNELRKVIEQTRRQFIYDTESSKGITFSLGWYATVASPELYYEYLPILEHTDARAVQTAVKQYLRAKRTLVSRVLPEAFDLAKLEPAVTITPAKRAPLPTTKEAETSVSQPSTDIPSAQKLETKEYRLKLGGTLIVRANPSNDVLAIRILFKGGNRLQPVPGMTDLLARMLTKGAGSRNAAEFAAYAEENGIDISARAENDYLEITAQGIRGDQDRMLELLSDVIYRPLLTAEDMEIERSLILKGIVSSRDRPERLANEKLLLNLYPGHGYGDVGERIETALPKLTRKQLIDYYQAQVNPATMVVAVVGNVVPDSIRDHFDSAFSMEREGTAESFQKLLKSARKAATAPASPITVKTPRPTEQTHVFRSYLTVPVMHPDYPALKVLSALLGQGLSSRLFVELRDKQGLAYTTYANFPHGFDPTGFTLYIATDPKNTQAVLSGFDEQVLRLRKEKISPAEVEFARNKFLGRFHLAHEKNMDQAFYLAFYELAGFGWTYDSEFPRRIQSVKAGDLTRVANRYLSKPSVTSILGPPAAIGAQPKQ